MAESGCTTFLATVDLVTRPSVLLTDIPVVRYFQDVFPAELTEMPRARDRIQDRSPAGTQPITKAPYRRAFAELKELKAQLEDLLDKGFI